MKQNIKQEVIFLKGLPASGKTRYASKLIGANSKYKRIGKDFLRIMIDGGEWSKSNEKNIIKSRDKLSELFLENGFNIIIDDTNFHEPHEVKLRELAKKYDARFVIKDFTDVPLETCLKRDSKRDNPVGRKNIMRMYNKYLKKQNEKPLNPVIFGDNLPYCVIFDLDGTIAHIHDRSPYDGKSCGSDLVNKSINNLINIIQSYNDIGSHQNNVRVIILSGRNGDSKPETIKWLKDNNISYDELHMRTPGDSRKDSVIKKEIFDEHIKDKYNVLFIVDDRDQMVKKWRSMGLTCLQCNYGDF